MQRRTTNQDGALLDFYDLISASPHANVSNRRSGQVLQPIDVCSRRWRQVRQSAYCSERPLPAGHRFVDRLDSPNRLHVRPPTIAFLSFETIADTYPESLE